MRRLAGVALALGLVLALAVPGYAWDRHRGHRHFHPHFRAHSAIVIGPPRIWVAPSYPYYVYAPSPPVVVREEPPVFVQQPPQESVWYYCANPGGYYPYVQQCPDGWQKVAPTPPGAPGQ
jgi:hypothetical protein